MPTVGATETNGDVSNLHRPVASVSRCNPRSLHVPWWQRPVRTKAKRSLCANARTPRSPVACQWAPPSSVNQSGVLDAEGEGAVEAVEAVEFVAAAEAVAAVAAVELVGTSRSKANPT
jgi:hypothetical protein